MEILKTSEDWQKQYPKIIILDPDGWNRDERFKFEWYEEQITLDQYRRKMSGSTVQSLIPWGEHNDYFDSVEKSISPFQENFIPYGHVLDKLRDYGFDEQCVGVYYTKDGDVRNVVGDEKGDAPLWQQGIDFLLKKIPEYSIRLCYNKTGEVYVDGNITYDIFNNLEECLNILIQIIEQNENTSPTTLPTE